MYIKWKLKGFWIEILQPHLDKTFNKIKWQYIPYFQHLGKKGKASHWLSRVKNYKLQNYKTVSDCYLQIFKGSQLLPNYDAFISTTFTFPRKSKKQTVDIFNRSHILF